MTDPVCLPARAAGISFRILGQPVRPASGRYTSRTPRRLGLWAVGEWDGSRDPHCPDLARVLTHKNGLATFVPRPSPGPGTGLRRTPTEAPKSRLEEGWKCSTACSARMRGCTTEVLRTGTCPEVCGRDACCAHCACLPRVGSVGCTPGAACQPWRRLNDSRAASSLQSTTSPSCKEWAHQFRRCSYVALQRSVCWWWCSCRRGRNPRIPDWHWRCCHP